MQSVPAPVIGALVSSIFAVAMAFYSLSVARRSRKTETTRELLRKYFSVEFTLIRRESLVALRSFWNRSQTDSDAHEDPLIRYLVNSPLHEYRFDQDRMQNSLSSQQNVLLLLYFFAEMEAYRRRDLLDGEFVKEILISQWELFRGPLTQIVRSYKIAVAADSQQRSSPPWVKAIQSVDAWMIPPQP